MAELRSRVSPTLPYPDTPPCPGRGCLLIMEQSNLVYNSSLKVVICVEHGYCLPASSVKSHLNRLHGVKGAQLRAACEEVREIETVDPLHLLQSHERPPVPYLSVDLGWQCTATACNHDNRSVSKSRVTVEKHLSEVHSIGRRPGKTPPQTTDLREVQVQSFLPNPYYRPFVVLQDCQESSSEQANKQQLQVTVKDGDESRTFLHEQYTSSQQSWNAVYHRLPTRDSQTVDPSPLWLLTSGISRWIQGLAVDKIVLREYVKPVACSNKTACSKSPRNIKSGSES